MKVSYFPGCTLNTKGKGFDRSVREALAALGVELEELPDWNCCGASFPLLVDNVLDLAGPARVLVAASAQGDKLATACTTCYNVLKRTNRVIRLDRDRRERLNYFIEADYQGQVEVMDVLQILRDEVGFEEVKAKVQKSLSGLKVACYYGCMVLRPPAEVAYDDPENPHALDELMASLGAEPVLWGGKVECCGNYLVAIKPELAMEMSYRIISSAYRAGAEVLVTNCPLCQFNLDRWQRDLVVKKGGFRPLPVLYFTQLLAIALGLDPTRYELEKHYVDPKPLLKAKGLLDQEVG